MNAHVTHILCNILFSGLEDEVEREQMLVIEDGIFTYVGHQSSAPRLPEGGVLVNAGNSFVMPGLIDVHTHLAFGNAQSEEDVDIYASDELRALRGLYFSQQVLSAGYTSMVCPGDSNQLSVSLRNVINAGMYLGPRIAASGRVVTNRQSLNDWYPSWVGTPEYFTARLVANRDEAIGEIRKQAKDGVDFIKIAMDGTHRRPNGEVIAAFTQEETTAMVTEAHRLGKRVAAHAYGREAVLYAARAGIDVIFHAFFMDDECIDAILEAGIHIAPTLTFPKNNAELSRSYEQSVKSGYVNASQMVCEIGRRTLRHARERGVPMMTGSDSGFAVTPYGEWHAREIEILVEDIGFTPAQALRAATSISAGAMPEGDKLGAIAPGRAADLIVVNGNPLCDVRVLQDKSRFHSIYKGGEHVELAPRRYNPRAISDFNMLKWTELYTQEFARGSGPSHAENAT